MNDMRQSLIDYEGERINHEWQIKHPYLSLRSFKASFQTFSTHNHDSFQIDSAISFQEKNFDAQESFSGQEEVQDVQRSCQVSKTKMIKKLSHNRDEDQQSYSNTNTSRRRRTKRGKQAKNKPYHTKNFLPNFKTPHLQFLRKFLKLSVEQFDKIPIISYLNDKNGISLEDYEALYNTPEFQSAFEAMFACKFLHRELLLSRSIIETKKNHLRKVHVFEKAFRTKIFRKIN